MASRNSSAAQFTEDSPHITCLFEEFLSFSPQDIYSSKHILK